MILFDKSDNIRKILKKKLNTLSQHLLLMRPLHDFFPLFFGLFSYGSTFRPSVTYEILRFLETKECVWLWFRVTFNFSIVIIIYVKLKITKIQEKFKNWLSGHGLPTFTEKIKHFQQQLHYTFEKIRIQVGDIRCPSISQISKGVECQNSKG